MWSKITKVLTVVATGALAVATTVYSNPSGPVYSTGGGTQGPAGTPGAPVQVDANGVTIEAAATVIDFQGPGISSVTAQGAGVVDVVVSGGSSGGGATTSTGGVTKTSTDADDFSLGLSTPGPTTSPLYFDVSSGDLLLNQPGASIIIEPHPTVGSALVLDEAGNSGSHSFTLKVPDQAAGGLTADVVCTLGSDGSIPTAGCPLLNNAASGGSHLPSVWLEPILDFTCTDTTCSNRNYSFVTAPASLTAFDDLVYSTALNIFNTEAGKVSPYPWTFDPLAAPFGDPAGGTPPSPSTGRNILGPPQYAPSQSANYATFNVLSRARGRGNNVGPVETQGSGVLLLELVDCVGNPQLSGVELFSGLAPSPVCGFAPGTLFEDGSLAEGWVQTAGSPGNPATYVWEFDLSFIAQPFGGLLAGGSTNPNHNTWGNAPGVGYDGVTSMVADMCGGMVLYDMDTTRNSFEIYGNFSISSRLPATGTQYPQSSSNADGFSANMFLGTSGFKYTDAFLQSQNASGLGNLDTQFMGPMPVTNASVGPLSTPEYITIPAGTANIVMEAFTGPQHQFSGQIKVANEVVNNEIAPYFNGRGTDGISSLDAQFTATQCGLQGGAPGAIWQQAAFADGGIDWQANSQIPFSPAGAGIASNRYWVRHTDGNGVTRSYAAHQEWSSTAPITGSTPPTCESRVVGVPATCSDGNVVWEYMGTEGLDYVRPTLKITLEP